MNIIKQLKQAFETTLYSDTLQEQSETLYWLYRMAKDNPKELEVAFLLEANKKQKQVIDRLSERVKL